MYSETDICNMALGWLGANKITNITDDSDEAELCQANYYPALRMALEAREWTFATRRRKLTPSSETPEFGYAYKFLEPSDCVRMLSVSQNPTDYRAVKWESEGGYILSDSAVLYVRYTFYLTDPTKFTPSFATAVAEILASFLAMPITENAGLVKLYGDKYEQMVLLGGGLDGAKGTSRTLRSHGLAEARKRSANLGIGNYI